MNRSSNRIVYFFHWACLATGIVTLIVGFWVLSQVLHQPLFTLRKFLSLAAISSGILAIYVNLLELRNHSHRKTDKPKAKPKVKAKIEQVERPRFFVPSPVVQIRNIKGKRAKGGGAVIMPGEKPPIKIKPWVLTLPPLVVPESPVEVKIQKFVDRSTRPLEFTEWISYPQFVSLVPEVPETKSDEPLVVECPQQVQTLQAVMTTTVRLGDPQAQETAQDMLRQAETAHAPIYVYKEIQRQESLLANHGPNRHRTKKKKDNQESAQAINPEDRKEQIEKWEQLIKKHAPKGMVEGNETLYLQALRESDWKTKRQLYTTLIGRLKGVRR